MHTAPSDAGGIVGRRGAWCSPVVHGYGPGRRNFWEQEWKATPAPVMPTQAKLIPIVSIASTADPIALARFYMHRWPVQKNIIRDWLITLGIRKRKRKDRRYPTFLQSVSIETSDLRLDRRLN